MPAAATGSWWEDVRNHRLSIALWFLLNLLDFGLTVAGLSLGGHEVNPFTITWSVPLFALQKIALTTLAVTWLALWRWLRFLKWLNLGFIALGCSNVYSLITLLY